MRNHLQSKVAAYIMALLATGVLRRVPAGLRAAVAMRDLTSTAHVSNSSHGDSGVPVSRRPGETVAAKRARLLYQSRYPPRIGASWTTLQGVVVGMGLRLKQTSSFHLLRRKRGTLENGLLLRYVLR